MDNNRCFSILGVAMRGKVGIFDTFGINWRYLWHKLSNSGFTLRLRSG